jgi:uncharacterized protein (DUF849 family)
MSKQAVWLEVALNGAAGQAMQPGIPVTKAQIIEEAVACVAEGAAIVHLHAYDDNGQPTEDADIYSAIIEAIKSRCDAIVYPTLSLTGSLEERFAPITKLAERGLLEWGVVDPGSVNISHAMHVAAGIDGLLYANPDEHIRTGLALAESQAWRPAYAIYEPGFARLGAAMAAQFADLQTPIYRVMFSDNLLFGMAPSEYAVEFYSRHFAEVAGGAPWMISGLDANIDAVIEPALDLGAHIRVGLEDASFGCDASNLELVKSAKNKIISAGYALATVRQIRSAK